MRRASPLLFFGLSAALHGAVFTGVWLRPRAKAVADPTPVLTGDTFDVTEVIEQAPPPPPAQVDPEPQATAPTRAVAPPRHAAAVATAAGSGTATAPTPPPLTYGAVGERAAVAVAVAFTRAFPQASSGDAVWASVPFGDAGSADITFRIEADGKLAHYTVSGDASPALRRAIVRTMALIDGRSFVATGPVTHLHVSSRVSPDAVHDGLHGDVFAIGGTFTSGEGSAFFALSIGRRVDVTVRESAR